MKLGSALSFSKAIRRTVVDISMHVARWLLP
jgi:hypothetical protein